MHVHSAYIILISSPPSFPKENKPNMFETAIQQRSYLSIGFVEILTFLADAAGFGSNRLFGIVKMNLQSFLRNMSIIGTPYSSRKERACHRAISIGDVLVTLPPMAAAL